MLIAFQQNNSSNGAVPDPSSLWRDGAARLIAYLNIDLHQCRCSISFKKDTNIDSWYSKLWSFVNIRRKMKDITNAINR